MKSHFRGPSRPGGSMLGVWFAWSKAGGVMSPTAAPTRKEPTGVRGAASAGTAASAANTRAAPRAVRAWRGRRETGRTTARYAVMHERRRSHARATHIYHEM